VPIEAEPDWQTFYNAEAGIHGASVRTSHYHNEKSFHLYRRSIFNWLGKLENQAILDAGCGVGAFTEHLLQDGNAVHGVDFSTGSLKFAAQRGLAPVCADVCALPFASGTFDLTLCISVLQHIVDYSGAIHELHRVTRPGGVLLVATLNRQAVQRQLLSLVYRPALFTHLHTYTLSELEAAYTELGLQEIEFLNLYHPFTCVTRHCHPGALQRYLSSTFVIKGRKPQLR